MKYDRRINNISEIYDGENLLISDFSNMDLSDFDLSIIPMEKWEDCIFYNTNFKNTKIKFIPSKLKVVNNKISIDFCDFSDNDLSYLKREDFLYRNYEISTYGCNFRNTRVNFLTKLRNIELDISYKNFDKEYFGTDIYFFINNHYFELDIDTLLKNPFLNISSARLLWTIYKYCQKIIDEDKQYDVYKYEITSIEFDTDEKVLEYKKKIISICENLLKLDKEGYAIKFYEMISRNMSIEQKFSFFNLVILKAKLKDIDLSIIPFGIVGLYQWSNNELNNIVISGTIRELLNMSDAHVVDYNNGNRYNEFKLPFINYSSWQENDIAKKKVSSSSISFFSKVYLELSRVCNADCCFCRNSSFTECEYNLENIKQTLDMIKKYINAIVIGGGEPTLRLDDVKELRSYITNDKIDWHIFTNGTKPLIIEDDYLMDNFRINLSRHAIDDRQNADIFHVESIMTTKDIERLNLRNGEVTLNATCFNGGLDSEKKIIEYIAFAKSVGCRKVLIQDLQKNTSLGCKSINYDELCINPLVFEKLIEYLKGRYKLKYPIYATGGYVTNVFYDKDITISIQRYITPEELKIKWVSAIKRTFDLSIDPSGNLYENWNQISGFVKKI